jgi:glyoxylase-like metal-dependent hydrolase (beta-lactamase superfamily II)
MTDPAPATVVNVGYRSTNYWVVSAGTSRLLVDLGWPGSMGQMRARLESMDVPMQQIRYGMATHYHMDHAGLGQELKLAGVPLLVADVQVAAVPAMKRWMKPRDGYVEIEPDDNVVVRLSESRVFLEDLGIEGQILHTPGHSDDSVSLLLDSGAAFTGDLTHPAMVAPGESEAVSASWQLLRRHGAVRIHPGHGPVWDLPA